MSYEVSSGIGLLIAVGIWFVIKHLIAVHRAAQQSIIAQAGETCVGRIVAIQRPFMLDDCTRLYFDFIPSGSQEPVRACHVARRAEGDSPRALPVPGATVTVRYLPERPQRAVIGKLVTG
jgi:hypothetical protein